MKNLHLLPTENSSRLVKIYNDVNRESFTLKLDVEVNDSFKEYVNVYITSDEEIKDGEWHLHYYEGKPVISKSYNSAVKVINEITEQFGYKKIILTTDKDLIKDGVQEIPDEFLEWFVENPSCEFAHLGFTSIIGDSETKRIYKIIIPKENPKQIKCYDKFNQILKEGDYVDVQKNGIHKIYKKEDGQLYFKPYGEEDKVSNYFSNDMVKCDKDGNWITNDRYEDMDEPKQETLEEAAEKWVFEINGNRWSNNDNTAGDNYGSFITGAKWQQERMYSEEEVRKIFDRYNEVIAHRDIGEWQPWIDKQFKKK